MKQAQITDQELIAALKHMAPETGSLLCSGCGHERRCATHGCAILREAAARLTELTAPPPNGPLTQEELREMGKDWVWIKLLVPLYSMDTGYYIKQKTDPTRDSFQCGYPHIWVRGLPYSLYGDEWLAYRRKPEEGTGHGA